MRSGTELSQFVKGFLPSFVVYFAQPPRGRWEEKNMIR